MKKTTLTPNNHKQILQDTIHTLKKGGLVIFPSDTVYGALVDATNENAVKKLINFKNRPIGKAISVFVSNLQMFEEQVHIKADKKSMLQTLLPGPFTVVLPSKHQVSQLLESEKGTLGVRIPDYPLVLDLLAAYAQPITATSANLGGRPPHYSLDSLLDELPQNKKDLIDLVIDAGKLPHNKPSTIIDLTESEVKILRHGDIVSTDEQTFFSDSVGQTKKVAEHIIQKFGKNISKKPLVIILEGDLGTGKTQFVKGTANMLGIAERIVSPTFVIYYEYKIDSRKSKVESQKLLHYDLYNITEAEEFNDIGIAENLKPGSIFCIEWGDKSGEIIDVLKQKADIIYVKILHVDEDKREIQVRQILDKPE